MKVVVRVKPGSKNDAVDTVGDELVIRTKAPAVDGKANEAVLKLLAKHFRVRKSQVRLISGVKSRKKMVEVTL